MKLAGVLAPLPTPFDERDQVDLPRLRRALARWVASPLAGFVLLGTTGEAGLLSEEEAERVVGEARQAIPPERPFIVGTGRESTHAAVGAARRAASLGADAILVRTPSAFKAQMTDDALIRYYSTVADASPVPALLYNFTAATGVSLSVRAVAALAAHGNIIGIKESGGDLARIEELVGVSSPRFTVLAGSGSTFYAALRAGVAGGILAVAAVLPDLCVRLFTLVKEGRFADAEALQQRLLPVANLVSSKYGVPGLKAAMNLLGVDVGVPRPPLVRLDAPGQAALAAALGALEGVLA